MLRLLLFLSLASLPLGACAPIAAPLPAAQSGVASDSVELTVGAAADLQFAFTELGQLFQEETGHRVTMVFGSTGQLAQQIENGAPYDLYAAANIEFVEMLAEKKLVLPETVALYARGRIVLAVNREAGVEASELDDLLAPEIQRIAIANPEHAPYGKAAKEALESSGVWAQLQDKLVLGENVRQTLQYVQTGDAQVGIVALSIADVPEITWAIIDDALHNPLDQALAVVSSSPRAAIAAEFAAFINGPTGRPIMQRYGFVLPGEAVTAPN